jgi:hypothetical protein
MVILFEMQRRKLASMTFSEAWTACERANVKLPSSTPISDRKLFAWRLTEALKMLEEDGWVSITYQSTKFSSITLTENGSTRLRPIIFTHQDRMGDRP